MRNLEESGQPLETPGESQVTIRRITEADVETLFNLFQRNKQYLASVNMYVPEEPWEIMSSPMPADRVDFCIIGGTEIAGKIDFIPQGPKRAEIMYWVDRDHQGRGYAAKALEQVVELGFNQGIESVRAWVSNDNLASQRTVQKVGFKPTLKNTAENTTCYELLNPKAEAASAQEI